MKEKLVSLFLGYAYLAILGLLIVLIIYFPTWFALASGLLVLVAFLIFYKGFIDTLDS